MASDPERPASARPFDRQSALAFCAELGAAVDALVAILEEETALVRAARLRDAAALSERKSAASERYARAHAIVRQSGRELGRLVAVEIDQIRRRHREVEAAITTNLAVLATARTVSETLIRDVAETDPAAASRPQTYSGDGRRNGAAPLARPIGVNVAL